MHSKHIADSPSSSQQQFPAPAAPRRRPGRRGHPALAAGALLVVGVSLAALTGCGNSASGNGDNAGSAASAPPAGKNGGKPLSKLLWMGDSIAEAEAPALEAAVKAGGAEFKSIASAGGGTVVKGEGPTAQFADDTYKQLAKAVETFHPDVIAYQVTTYDWGTAAQQAGSYERLAKAAKDAGAELVIVSAPPFKIDDFYKSHEAAIKSAPKAAQDAAAKNAGQVRFFDAAGLWGTDSAAAKAQRSQDGIHTCQQGAAAFANWFGGQLSRHYSFTPAAPEKWAKGTWTGSKVYGQLKCG
ncbi:SGNH hydrolase domain-containing protein [Streptomyces rimosus]|uniref:SGNH hydrolase domain-containing protein n=1 Tax=Streptomyces rimosus TaxID=1927 RepID=UPI00067D220F|nr:SGNH hydrolase domain-containing protein [Streptomyces rimosus]